MKSRTVLLVILFMLLGGGALLVVERSISAYRMRQDREKCVNQLKALKSMLRTHAAIVGPYPTSLAAVSPRPSRVDLIDPWGWEIVYFYPARPGKTAWHGFSLYSVGPNGLDEKGEGDDVIIW